MPRAWIDQHAEPLAAKAERDLEALVAVSSPSGDAAAAEEAIAIATALAPEFAEVERIPCSSPEHAPDLLLRVRGPGPKRILLVGHLDTVVAHDQHVAPHHEGRRVRGSGTIDMKGGDALAIGVLRAVAGRPELGEAVLLLVNDEEWRLGSFGHVGRFAGFDACLCFEAGERTPERDEAVVVRRKAAGTVRVRATGRAAHSGAAPDKGINALLALAQVAQAVAACHDPAGPSRRTAVPTILHSGTALNVVPADGELICDVRADDLDAIRAVLDVIPAEVGGAAITTELQREWPGMDARETVGVILQAASEAIGAPIRPASRGGASDASHFAATIPVTIDGLGPRGGHAHNPAEFIDLDSLLPRARVALGITDAILRSA